MKTAFNDPLGSSVPEPERPVAGVMPRGQPPPAVIRWLILIWFAAACCRTLLGCCPQSECSVATNDPGYRECVYWGNPARNTGKLMINFGDSIGVGASCLRRSGGEVIGCGYIHALEQRFGGIQIANFSMGRQTAAAEVASGFSIVRDSVLTANPDARRAYIHVGASDIREYLQADCSEFPLAFDPETRTCDWVSEEKRMRFFEKLESVAADVRGIVEEYQKLGVREVVVGSFHPVEETADSFLSCAHAICPNFQDYPCLNELSEFFSVELQNMVAALGSSAAGVYFADHLHGFPVTEPGACTISCDCVHLNCYGHDVMAQIWYEALPVVPMPDG